MLLMKGADYLVIYQSIKMCPCSLFLSSDLLLLAEKKSHRKAAIKKKLNKAIRKVSLVKAFNRMGEI